MKLYEYAILYHPRPVKTKEGEEEKPQRSTLLSDVQRVLANNEKEAAMIAARAIPESHIDKLDRVEIALRPF